MESLKVTEKRLEQAQLGHVPIKQIQSEIRAYKSLLDSRAPETAIQDFLAKHVYFFNSIARHTVPVYSKVRLGTEYEADFAFFDPSSYGVEWNFVELEAPSKKLFTQSVRPTSALTHAIEQARDWNKWISENLSYARKLFPLVQYPFFYVFMGRRKDLTSAMRDKLRQMNFDSRNWLEIRTLDRFIDGAESAKNLRVIQRSSYSHANLSRREPRENVSYITNEHAKMYKKRGVARLLEERDGGDDPTYFPGD